MRRPDITKQILQKLYVDKKLSKREIALQLHCNIITIHNKIRRFKIPVRNRLTAVRIAMKKRRIKIPKNELQKLYQNQKCSIGEIAVMLKYDRATIQKLLEGYKIPLRSKAEAVKLGSFKRKLIIPKSHLENLYLVKGMTQKQIAKKIGRDRIWVLQIMKKYGIKTRGAAYYHTLYPRHNFSRNLKEKSYLIGFRLGDLHVKMLPSQKTIRIDCTSTKYDQIVLFKKLFSRYGHIWIGKPRKDGNRVFVTFLNLTFGFLLPKHATIPSWIFRNNKYFLPFLAGYTDAEGCIWTNNKYIASYTIASYDKLILKQIHEKLTQLGIKCPAPKILVKKGYRKSDGSVYHHDHWYLTSTKKSEVLKILNLLQSQLKHKKRLKDLYKTKNNIFRRNQTLLEKYRFKYSPV